MIVTIDDPLNPVVKRIAELKHPRAIAIQFRYGFVVDDEGLKVRFDVIGRREPGWSRARCSACRCARCVRGADLRVCGGRKRRRGDLDVEQPENHVWIRRYNADGKLNDVHQVKIAMTNASLFAYVADGHNGLRILQLTSPETMPKYAGFSPRPQPLLIATFKTQGEALGVSKPLDRDRAADESGNQVSVFGRRGARPFTFGNDADAEDRMMDRRLFQG